VGGGGTLAGGVGIGLAAGIVETLKTGVVALEGLIAAAAELDRLTGAIAVGAATAALEGLMIIGATIAGGACVGSGGVVGAPALTAVMVEIRIG
jgi:hypothetical protein